MVATRKELVKEATFFGIIAFLCYLENMAAVKLADNVDQYDPSFQFFFKKGKDIMNQHNNVESTVLNNITRTYHFQVVNAKAQKQLL